MSGKHERICGFRSVAIVVCFCATLIEVFGMDATDSRAKDELQKAFGSRTHDELLRDLEIADQTPGAWTASHSRYILMEYATWQVREIAGALQFDGRKENIDLLTGDQSLILMHLMVSHIDDLTIHKDWSFEKDSDEAEAMKVTLEELKFVLNRNVHTVNANIEAARAVNRALFAFLLAFPSGRIIQEQVDNALYFAASARGLSPRSSAEKTHDAVQEVQSELHAILRMTQMSNLLERKLFFLLSVGTGESIKAVVDSVAQSAGAGTYQGQRSVWTGVRDGAHPKLDVLAKEVVMYVAATLQGKELVAAFSAALMEASARDSSCGAPLGVGACVMSPWYMRVASVGSVSNGLASAGSNGLASAGSNGLASVVLKEPESVASIDAAVLDGNMNAPQVSLRDIEALIDLAAEWPRAGLAKFVETDRPWLFLMVNSLAKNTASSLKELLLVDEEVKVKEVYLEREESSSVGFLTSSDRDLTTSDRDLTSKTPVNSEAPSESVSRQLSSTSVSEDVQNFSTMREPLDVSIPSHGVSIPSHVVLPSPTGESALSLHNKRMKALKEKARAYFLSFGPKFYSYTKLFKLDE